LVNAPWSLVFGICATPVEGGVVTCVVVLTIRQLYAYHKHLSIEQISLRGICHASDADR
jgi:hypothetical protein